MTASAEPTTIEDVAHRLLDDLAPECEMADVLVGPFGRQRSVRCPRTAAWIVSLRYECGATSTVLACDECASEIRGGIHTAHPGGLLGEPYEIDRMEKF